MDETRKGGVWALGWCAGGWLCLYGVVWSIVPALTFTALLEKI